LDGVEPGPVVYVVAIIQVDGLFDGADAEAGEAFDGLDEVAIGAGVVVGPTEVALGPIAAVGAAGSPAPPVAGRRRIHEARKNPLGFLARSSGNGEVFVLIAGIDAERFLKGAEQRKEASGEDQ
jgi:hypothetical protein